MHLIKYIVSVCLALFVVGCVSAPAPTATLAPIPTLTLPPTIVTSPTSVNSSDLKAGQWSFIFYHDTREQVILVNGGPERGKPAGDPLELWGWDGAQWSVISADENGPSWRNWAAAAYDTARDVLVIHGGLQQRGTSFDETWEWDGQGWTRFEGSGPGAREGALMAFDADRANMVLFGGATPDMEIHGDTWEWDGQSWTKTSESGPAPRFPGAMAYDAVRKVMLVYSGHFADPSGDATDYDDLWAWDGSSWGQIAVEGLTPDHRTHAGFLFDPVTESVLLIGSGSDTFLSDIWAWNGTSWQEIPTTNTPARSGLNVAYDPARDRFVLFGGVDRPGGEALDDTWEWDRKTWVCIHNCK